MNVHESEKLSGMIEQLGYTLTDDDNKANLIVFNTCCIRENAESHAHGNIGALKPIKKKKRDLIIAVGGCMTQQPLKAEKLRETFPFVDIVFGTHNLTSFKELLLKRLSTNKPVVEVLDIDGNICEDVVPNRTSYPNAWVNIMYGCNNFCSYCIVPYVRGRERSREPKNILAEVKSLINDGYKEITLLGQNVDSYGKTLNNPCDFADLLEQICQIEGKFRLRFMSNHPKDINEKLVKVIKKYDNICKSIHLPMQSGSTNVLRDMNRKYTQEDFLNKVEILKSNIPNIAITTDIMVGFPNESDEDFNDTMEVVKKVEFDGAFTFVYSRRKNTKADLMEGHISDDIKKRRIMALVDLQNKINNKKSLEYTDKIVEVLCEDYDSKKQIYQGRDDRGRMVYFKSETNLIGSFVLVKIKKTGGITLLGELVNS